MKWIEALKQWNKDRDAWCMPRKGTAEHAQVMAIMGKSAKKVEKKEEAKGAPFDIRASFGKKKEAPKAEAPKAEPPAKPSKKSKIREELEADLPPGLSPEMREKRLKQLLRGIRERTKKSTPKD